LDTPKRDRRYYLDDIPLPDALARFKDALKAADAAERSDPETIPLAGATGRVTASPVWARRSSPHYDAAAMDGAAVRSTDTVGANETAPITLAVGDQARWVDTGDLMPAGFDAVAMIEVVRRVDDDKIELRSAVPPYHNVRPLGEDIVATELVLPEGRRLRPYDLAACAAAGLSEVTVRRRPSVGILPTGSELVPPGSTPRPGGIIESNGLMLAAMAKEWGADAVVMNPVPDVPHLLKAALLDALGEYDVVVVNAGSSAGSEDYTASLVEEMGELLVHGVAIRPGHPVVLGIVTGKPILGIPGYPVSAALTLELFLKPLVEIKLGLKSRSRETTNAVLTRKILSPMGEDEYLRVRLGVVGEKRVATPIQRGAGVIMSLVRADGIVTIPRFSEGLDAGTTVDVELLASREEISDAMVVTGSHDVVLDLLASELSRQNPGRNLASSNVGSLGGLLALSRGEAHLAGTHLLDESTGEYNLSYIRRHLKGIPIVLVALVGRVQGLLVPNGNPMGITGLADLARDDVTFVNRQRGSGTRLLLDHMLRGADIPANGVGGYEREEYTHLAVAATVAGGSADVGLGILSAARAVGTEFIPLANEQYDLAIPTDFYEGEALAPLLDLIRDDAFRQQVDALGGYDTSRMGEVVATLGED
jgi:putative molybdopterin biosynthesis protein